MKWLKKVYRAVYRWPRGLLFIKLLILDLNHISFQIMSESILSSARPLDVSENNSLVTGDWPRVLFKRSILQKTDQELSDHVRLKFFERYKQEARDLQVECVVALVRGKPTFLCAGTGFGKTRVAEMFRELLSLRSLAIVLIFNPLDALGDNQVRLKVIGWWEWIV